ncbi:sensor histidine kinase [Paenimyroides baculatum]|uniref:histidine kinase n=1 Tax=Paenimyroides baculatum TaxID=2608000 RepID=A0A5M6CX36_9FLAO|nr:HAMP domain-containing sensor histidine kinase [Paenimyroides baculatum]KAA5537809.1 HAMP domain-containing histidine kinase [Paenimyroides baculatum]
MSISLKNYTLKYLALALLVIIAVWAALFYAVILDELYDNTDDGLKDLKIQIIRKAYTDEATLQIKEFNFNQFKITPVNHSQYKEGNFFRNQLFYMEYDDEMEPYRILETYFVDRNGNCQKLEIRTSTVEEDDFRLDLFFALIFLYIFLVVSIVLINNIVLKKVWKPFYITLDNLGKYEFGKLYKAKQSTTEIREFKLLDQKIDKMIERNEAAFLQQKQFIENASHELQTPLAIAINKLDLLIEKESFPQDNLIDLSETKNGLIRLVNLNKSLLMLSRIENNQYADKSEIEMNEVLKHVLEDFLDLLQFKNIDLDFSESAQFKTVINPDLAYILISNLIRNAVKYNSDGGKIIVTVDSYGVEIKNTSIGNEPLSELVFNRFYKAVNDNSSTGLGLSIVKSIAENHAALNILYSFENNFHVFSLKTKNS